MTNIDVLISGGSNPDLVGEIRRIVGGLRPFIDMPDDDWSGDE